jgi:hypothetical protein
MPFGKAAFEVDQTKEWENIVHGLDVIGSQG